MKKIINYGFTAAAVALWIWGLSACATKPIQVDLLIKNATVVDGTGAKSFTADIGITGDRIRYVGSNSGAFITAERVIDAVGKMVTPGFIDPHTHADAQLANPRSSSNQAYLFQGVTTVLTGNDGEGPWPIGETITKWQQQGVGTNVGLFVGHGTLRIKVLGLDNKTPTSEELERMRAMVKQGMNEGAFGLSTGLFYAPAIFAKTDEIVELAKVSAAAGGIYDTHMRSESSAGLGLLGAIKETIQVGRESKSAVHISHIKGLGSDMWGSSVEAVALVNSARAEGIKVTANQYPYSASALGLISALIPAWAQAGGPTELIKRIDDPAQRTRLDEDVQKNLKIRGGPDAIQFRVGAPDAIVSKKLADLMKTSNKTALETAYDLLKLNVPLPIVSFNMSETDIENFMKQSWVMTGSDGTLGHPRMYGTFPRKLSEYVRQRKTISIEQAVYSSTGLTAATFGIKDRGVVREGAFADLVIFDPATITDNASYLEPTLLPSGIQSVVVNGQVVIENGQYSGKLAGSVLRK